MICGIIDVSRKGGKFISCYKKLAGKRFGRLTVLSYQGNDKNRAALWLCRCDCGNEIVKTSSYLTHSKVASCGCLAKEKCQRMGKSNLKYPNAIPRLLSIWTGMKYRCNNEKSTDWKNYGGRGIKICEDWMNSFDSFQYWAIFNGYKEGLTIERKDVNGDYCPENCCWIANKEQIWNRTTTIRVDIDGKQYVLKDLCDKYNLVYNRVVQRIKKGWDIKIALFAPRFYRGDKKIKQGSEIATWLPVEFAEKN